MATIWNRAGHYIFALWFLLLLLSLWPPCVADADIIFSSCGLFFLLLLLLLLLLWAEVHLIIRTSGGDIAI